MTRETPTYPPLPPSTTPDLVAVRERATEPEALEFLGEFDSLEDYFTSQLEELIDPCIPWIWDCIDWRAVRNEFEAGGFRYLYERGQVYRVGIPTPPDPHGPHWIGRAV